MSDGYRNGAFALGLVVGGGVVLNLFLWLDYRAQYQANQTSDAQSQPDYSQVGGFWDGLIRTFISPTDTLAQWIMAVFTIAATVVLVLTLRSANKTNQAAVKASSAALEANQIIRAEQRPWLKIHEPTLTSIVSLPFGFRGGDRSIRIEFSVMFENVGKTPALRVNSCQNYAEGFDKFVEKDKILRRAFEASKGANVILPTEVKNLRLNGVVDVNLPPTGARNNLDLWVSVGAAYRIEEEGENKITWRRFTLSQKQDGADGFATLCALDLHDIEAGTAEIEFAPILSEAT